MPDNSSIIYGLEFQVRALSAVVAETETTKFLIGTQSTKMTNNQVHLIHLDEDDNLSSQIYQHKDGEIWSLASSPHDSSLLSTVFNSLTPDLNCVMGASLWKIPDIPSDTTSGLEPVLTLDTQSHGAEVKVCCFHPVEKNKVGTVVDNKVLIQDILANTLVSSIVLERKGQPKFTTGKWNPQNNSSQFVGVDDTNIRGWDLRTPSKCAWSIEGAHSQLIRDLDLNPNKQYIVASCGDDGKSKFWDLRSPGVPLVCRSDHSHWIWNIRYNHYHDQLVATASSDTRVLVTCLQSISSEPTPSTPHTPSNESSPPSIPEHTPSKETDTGDRVIARFDQHEESVYCVEWSGADPWTLASLSYDGRLLINRVPKAEKYKILALD
uniref:Protein TSSC1 n=2 Tax=Cacopsylla melanoneura TaxID=428564 RepID=A0A8D9F929_9HEMI